MKKALVALTFIFGLVQVGNQQDSFVFAQELSENFLEFPHWRLHYMRADGLDRRDVVIVLTGDNRLVIRDRDLKKTGDEVEREYQRGPSRRTTVGAGAGTRSNFRNRRGLEVVRYEWGEAWTDYVIHFEVPLDSIGSWERVSERGGVAGAYRPIERIFFRDGDITRYMLLEFPRIDFGDNERRMEYLILTSELMVRTGLTPVDVELGGMGPEETESVETDER
jgi:hypothetical protein